MLAVLPRMDFTPPAGWDSWSELAVELSSAEVQTYLGVKPERLRQWVQRGNVRRLSPTTYDMGSVMTYLWQRQQRGELTA